MEFVSLRASLVQALCDVAEKDSTVMLLAGDVGYNVLEPFIKAYPKRYFNCGIAEQNMVGMAAGLVVCGHKVVVYSITPFVTLRCLEQVRNDVCLEGRAVVFVGVGEGWSYGTCGATHHAMEDLAVMSCMPEMTVVCPGDARETRCAIMDAIAASRPCYLRLPTQGPSALPCDDICGPSELTLGRATWLSRGTQATVIACGGMVSVAAEAVALLKTNGISVGLVSMHTIKPVDTQAIIVAATSTPIIVTVEEHVAVGGLASHVGAVILRECLKVRFVSMCAEEPYSPLSGDQQFHRNRNRLEATALRDRVTLLVRGVGSQQRPSERATHRVAPSLPKCVTECTDGIANTLHNVSIRTIKRAARARRMILEISHARRGCHIGSSLSCVDLLCAVHENFLRWGNHLPLDRLIVSKGHAALALYVVLAQQGILDENCLRQHYGTIGSCFSTSVSSHVPGVEISTGSLGHGLSVGVGMALASKEIQGVLRPNVVVLLGDGECNEGSTWEACLAASHWRLGGLIAIVDYNKLQGMGKVQDVMALDSLSEKFRAFGWEVAEVDGHDHYQLNEVLRGAASNSARASPLAIIAHTIKGKGVSFMEGEVAWHYKNLDDKTVVSALKEIRLRPHVMAVFRAVDGVVCRIATALEIEGCDVVRVGSDVNVNSSRGACGRPFDAIIRCATEPDACVVEVWSPALQWTTLDASCASIAECASKIIWTTISQPERASIGDEPMAVVSGTRSTHAVVIGTGGHIGGFLERHLRVGRMTCVTGRATVDLTNNEAVRVFFLENDTANVIFLCAGVGGARTREDDEIVYDANVSMFRNVVEHKPRPATLVYMSSGAALDRSRNITEDMKPLESAPQDPYGRAKYDIEKLCRERDDVVMLRIFGCFGPGEKETRFVSSCLRAARTEKEVAIHDDRRFSFISVDDLAEICQRVVDGVIRPSRQALNACYDDAWKLSDIAKYLRTSPSIEKVGLDYVGKSSFPELSLSVSLHRNSSHK